ncbi:MAG: lipoate--protein ligase family protein [Deltaproteobacteria bacterium]|nr:lipoate--protein ligase family protein [Deltaproteobacteria bacterium]MBI3387330.1 lipoate--protein ligase family protein [Deltaproteobacteria bacterium]
MQTVDFIVEEGVTPAHSLAADRHFMHAVPRASRTRNAVLRVYTFPGNLLALGRYHLAPPNSSPAGGITPIRRHSGGRALPFGDGFVGLSLVLPHRSALFSQDPFALAPYQVLNRYVRGVLESCKLVNMPAFYPGRDFVTVDGRIIGMVSFETDEAGALLFEAILANTRDFSALPRQLEAVDPTGVIKAEMLTPDSTTSLARELGTELALGEVAEMLQRGFAKQYGLLLEPHTLSPLEVQAIDALAGREFQPDSWLRQRQPRLDLDHAASTWVQLGIFETHFSLEQDRFLKEIQFSGDFIANSPAVTRLEHELRLCPAEWRAIDAVASEIFSQPEHFILGIGKARAIADTIMRGLSA